MFMYLVVLHIMEVELNMVNHILIPTIKEWLKNPELIIIPNDSTHDNWNNLKDVKRIITRWLYERSLKDEFRCNLLFIIKNWNLLNENNKNVRQVDNNGEDLL